MNKGFLLVVGILFACMIISGTIVILQPENREMPFIIYCFFFAATMVYMIQYKLLDGAPLFFSTVKGVCECGAKNKFKVTGEDEGEILSYKCKKCGRSFGLVG